MQLGLKVAAVDARADFNVDRIFQIEAEVKHDVIAFLESLMHSVGPEHRNVASTLNNLAEVYRAQGRWEDALGVREPDVGDDPDRRSRDRAFRLRACRRS